MEGYSKLKGLLPWVGMGLLTLVFLKYLLPLVLPVLLGISIAAGLSPLIRSVQSWANLRYGTAAALSVSGVLLVLSLLLFLTGKFMLSELTTLYGQLPGMLERISEQGGRLVLWAERFSRQLPDSVGDALRNWAEGIVSSGGTVAGKLYEGLFSLVSGFLSRLPDNMLFLLTLILSCYFGAGELPRISGYLRQRLPGEKWHQITALVQGMKNVLGNWIRAQIKLMGVTFLILWLGFLLLREKPALLLAMGIALLDALPLFGTGTVLLPWGLYSMMTGNFRLGLGLLLLYGGAALCRNVLEPKLLGAQMGVSPLVTLLAIYVGYRLSGFVGMVLLPIFVMLAAELVDARYMAERGYTKMADEGGK